MCGHGQAEPRRDAHRGRRLDGGDETNGGTLEHAHVHGFAQLFAEPVHDRLRRALQIDATENRESDAGDGRPGAVDLGNWILADEAAVLQHREQPVRGRGGDIEMACRLAQSDLRLFGQEQDEPQRLIHRLDRILRNQRIQHIVSRVSPRLPSLHNRDSICLSSGTSGAGVRQGPLQQTRGHHEDEPRRNRGDDHHRKSPAQHARIDALSLVLGGIGDG